jgi:hypothetical protein
MQRILPSPLNPRKIETNHDLVNHRHAKASQEQPPSSR